MPKRRSMRYWAERRAIEMKHELDPVEGTADALTALYILASRQVEKQATDIVKKFQLEYNLTQKEARRLVSTVIDPADVDAIMKELTKDPRNQELIMQLDSQAYGARLNQLRKVQRSVDEVTKQIYKKAHPMMTEALAGITEQSYLDTLFDMQQMAGIGFEVPPLSPKRVEEIINRPYSGANYSQRLWANTERLAQRVKEEIAVGVLTGKTPHRMAQAIEDEFHGGASNSRRLIRTEASYAANDIQLQMYKEMGFEKYVYVAILDLRTSEICRSLDMKKFRVDEAMPGVNYPPMHPYCRSTTVADLPDWLTEGMTRNAVNPETGELIEVPANMSYDEWFKKFVKKGARI